MNRSWLTVSFFFLLAALRTTVRSQLISFNYPNINFVCTPDTICPITWDFEHSGPLEFTHADFFLLKFAFGHFFIVHPIAYELNLSETSSILWRVPKDEIDNGQYVVGAVAFGTDYAILSDHFWILRDY